MAFIHSLRIALEGEGIENYMSDADRIFMGISAGPTVGSASRLLVAQARIPTFARVTR